MSTRTRIGITIASALALGVTVYGQSTTAPGLENQIWGWSVLAAYAFALVGVALVDRWWALLPGVVPLAVTTAAINLTDHSTRWDSESIDLSFALGLAVVIIAIGIQAVLLSLGFLLRRAWIWGRRRLRSRTQEFEAGRSGA